MPFPPAAPTFPQGGWGECYPLFISGLAAPDPGRGAQKFFYTGHSPHAGQRGTFQDLQDAGSPGEIVDIRTNLQG